MDLFIDTLTLKYSYAGRGRYGWWAHAFWQDGSEYLSPEKVVGEFNTSYARATPAEAVNAVLTLAQRFGMRLRSQVGPVFDITPSEDGDESARRDVDIERVCREESARVSRAFPTVTVNASDHAAAPDAAARAGGVDGRP